MSQAIRTTFQPFTRFIAQEVALGRGGTTKQICNYQILISVAIIYWVLVSLFCVALPCGWSKSKCA